MVRMRVVSILLAIFIAVSGMNMIFDFMSDYEVVLGKIHYVGGSGAGNYTTIQAAVDNAIAGDTIYVVNGTYNESVLVDKTLTLIGNSSANVTVGHSYTGTNEDSNFAAAFNITANWVNITGFIINVSGAYTHGMRITSNNNHIYGNRIGTDGTRCFGIYLASSNDNTLNNNMINTLQSYSYGVRMVGASNNICYYNNMTTASGHGRMYFIYQSNNNDIYNNTLSSQGSFGQGVSLQDSDGNEVFNNTMKTGGTFAAGVVLWTSDGNHVHNNTMNTSGASASPGVHVYNSILNRIENNTINTSQAQIYGIHLEQVSYDNSVYNNTIYTHGTQGHGIYTLANSDNNDFYSNTINIYGNNAHGILLNPGCDGNVVKYNNVTTHKQDDDGIRTFNSANNFVISNTVVTYGKSGRAITILTGRDNYVAENTIDTYGNQGMGLNLATTINVTVYDNTVRTHLDQAKAVWLYGSDSNILYNTLSTNDEFSFGIEISNDYAVNNKIIGNTINVKGNNSYGVRLNTLTANTQVLYNEINTSGDQGSGIRLGPDTNNNTLYGNTITTNLTNSPGILIDKSVNNSLYVNDITTENQNSHGIRIQGSTNHTIDGGTISTAWNFSHGVFVTDSRNTSIGNVKIDTADHNASGIVMRDAKANMVYNNVITTKKDTAVGIQLWPNTHENNVANNVVSTAGYNATGILVGESSNTTLMNNTVTTTGNEGHGMIFYQSMHQALYLNNITTWGMNLSGVMLVIDTINTTISNIQVTGHGAETRGIQIHDANDTFVVDAEINLTDPQTAGVHFTGAGTPMYRALMVNSKITTAGGQDINVGRDANMTVFNTTFSTVEATQDGGGVLQVYNPLYLQVYFQDGITPMAGADFQVQDNGAQIYGSSGYGGSDAQTDASGNVGRLIVADRWYIYSNTATENTTAVSVKRTIDASWEEVRSDVNMSTGHTEVFTATDITGPATPTGLDVVRVAGKNEVTISWNSNVDPDIKSYSVESNKSGSWQEISNVPHPTVTTTDGNLVDETWYFYRIRALDTADIPSPYSTVVSIYLSDITPPAVPTGLSVQPVQGGDALTVSWDQNQDDTVMYEVFISTSPSGPFELVENVSHPQSSATGGEGELIHGVTYYFRLRAWDDNGNPSDPTDVVSVVHQDQKAPEAPPGIAAVTLSEHAINVTWSASPDYDVQGYRLYINATGSSSTFTLVDEFDNNTFYHEFAGLSENTTYYFVVDSFDEADNSNRSAIAQNTTESGAIVITPPGKPVLDAQPEYTNKVQLNVTGTADINVDVLVYLNTTLAGTTPSDAAGKFWLLIDLNEGPNAIKAIARKAGPVYGEYSSAITVILDTVKPMADAGADVEINPGDTVKFDASGSTDNLGIANYSWSFDDGSRATVRLYGESAEYKFDNEGTFEVALTILDLAGNSDTDSMKVTVKSEVVVDRPKIVSTYPANAATDVPLNTSVTITFSMPMDTKSVENVFDMEPKLLFDINWTGNNTVFRLDFRSDLKYGTTYNITIGNAKGANGEFLENAPFVLSFTTVFEDIEPVKPTITITPLTKTQYSPGETITISGTTTGIDEGTNVSVTLDGTTATDTLGSDGSWSVTVKLPEKEGTYTITVKIGNETSTTPLTVKKPVEDDKEAEGANTMLYLGLVIVVIIIVLGLLMMMRRKKPVKEEGEEEEEEEEVEEEGEKEPEEEEEEAAEEEAEEEEVEEEEAEEEGEEEAEEEAVVEEDVAEEEIEDFEEEPELIKTVNCPKCDADIDVPESDGPKVSLECPNCGARGRIKNPYL